MPPATFSDRLARHGAWFFKYRNYVFPLVLIGLLGGFEPARPLDGALEPWSDALGVLLSALGSVVRGWTIGLAYIKRGGLNKHVYADTLVTTGMFGVCRNPLYVGNFLILAGLFVVHGNPWAMGLGFAFFIYAYMGIVIAEERFLNRKFSGAYHRYCDKVSRFWPNFSRYREATEGMSFNWRRVVAKDSGTVFTWVIAMTLLFAGEDFFAGATSLNAYTSELAVFAVAAVLFIVARILKARHLV